MSDGRGARTRAEASDTAMTDAGNTSDPDDRATTRSSSTGRPSIEVEEKAAAPAKPQSGIQKLIAWVMALRPVRVFLRFGASGGEIMASGMSFQAVFAVFAGIWVGFSIFGIVLASNPALMDAVVAQLSNAIPGLIGENGRSTPRPSRRRASSAGPVP